VIVDMTIAFGGKHQGGDQPQPLDPQRLAEGIVDPQEALEIYYVSCAVIDIDHFMERVII
jgi:uncharacterized membrane protein YebE (DUF533 family)